MCLLMQTYLNNIADRRYHNSPFFIFHSRLRSKSTSSQTPWASGLPGITPRLTPQLCSLLSQPGMEDVALFSPCANSMFPIHINPFRFPKGMKLADHINRLMDVFNGTFKLDPPMPMLLTEGIQTVYEDLGWLPGMVNQGLLPYPTMSKLYVQVEKLLDKYQYADEVRSNLQSILQVRIGSLLQREMGDTVANSWLIHIA